LRTIAPVLFVFDNVIADHPVAQGQSDVDSLHSAVLCLLMRLRDGSNKLLIVLQHRGMRRLH
jgi:hypothetical protein